MRDKLLDAAKVRARAKATKNHKLEAISAIVVNVVVTLVTMPLWPVAWIVGAVVVVTPIVVMATRWFEEWWARFHTVPLEMLEELAVKGAWPEDYKPIGVLDKTFKNERVLLDGHAYSNCTFENVTLVYNGTTPIQFAYNKVNGFRYHSDNQALLQLFALLYGTGALVEGFKVEGISEDKLSRPITTGAPKPSAPNSEVPPPKESAS